MKISCEIIKDLIPLYCDGVCSKESKAVVEEHLADCENCKAELLAMGEELPVNNSVQNLNEAETLKELSNKWRKGNIKSFLKGTLIAVVVIAVIFLLLYAFLGFKIIII
jgi:Predicted integral membrane protein